MNKISKFFVLSLLLMVVACSQNSKIITTNNVSIIESELRNANKGTLVIFDINDVLHESTCALFRAPNSDLLKNLLASLSKGISSQDEKENLISIVVQNPVVPVDAKLVEIIEKLQQKGVKVLSLTNGLTGKYGEIDCMEDLSLQQLAGLGYHFEKSWPTVENSVLSGTKDQSVLFKNGVIFTSVLRSKASKGEALLAFLKYAKVQPEKIIFVDDKRKHLESVSSVAKKVDADFTGIEYTAAKDRNTPKISEEHAKLQLKVLKKEHKLLSDEELQKRLCKK